MIRRLAATSVLIALCGALPAAGAGAGALVPSPPIVVPRHPGGFDYMTVDAGYRRLLAAHSAEDQLAIVDMQSGAVIAQVDLGAGAKGAGVAVDVRDGKYFVGLAANRVADINRKNMVLQAYITLPGPIDALAFDPDDDVLFADEWHGSHVWAINAKTNALVATIPLPNIPEYLDYDPVTRRIYQAIKPEPSLVEAIDPKTEGVVQSWPTAPASGLHGLAIDGATGRVFTVGVNGKLAVLDVKTGVLVATVEIPPRVDQIAFDPATKRLYCPSVTGVMSVVQETDAGAAVLGSVAIPRGTHSVAVDPKTHAVWISYGAPEGDFVQKLTPSP